MGGNFTWTLELLHNFWVIVVLAFMGYLAIYHIRDAIIERIQRKKELIK